MKALYSRTFVVHISEDLSHVRSLPRRLRLRHHGCALVRGSPREIKGGERVRKPLIFMHFHGAFLGNQHAIWSKQHNGKVSLILVTADARMKRIEDADPDVRLLII